MGSTDKQENQMLTRHFKDRRPALNTNAARSLEKLEQRLSKLEGRNGVASPQSPALGKSSAVMEMDQEFMDLKERIEALERNAEAGGDPELEERLEARLAARFETRFADIDAKMAAIDKTMEPYKIYEHKVVNAVKDFSKYQELMDKGVSETRASQPPLKSPTIEPMPTELKARWAGYDATLKSLMEDLQQVREQVDNYGAGAQLQDVNPDALQAFTKEVQESEERSREEVSKLKANVKETMDEGFDHYNQNFSKAISGFEKKLNTNDASISSIKSKIKEMEKGNKQLNSVMDDTIAKVDEMEEDHITQTLAEARAIIPRLGRAGLIDQDLARQIEEAIPPTNQDDNAESTNESVPWKPNPRMPETPDTDETATRAGPNEANRSEGRPRKRLLTEEDGSYIRQEHVIASSPKQKRDGVHTRRSFKSVEELAMASAASQNRSSKPGMEPRSSPEATRRSGRKPQPVREWWETGR